MRRMLHFWYEDMIHDLDILLLYELPSKFPLLN
jgi:hypothetical protein